MIDVCHGAARPRTLILAGLLLASGPVLADDPAVVTTRATARERLANTVADVSLAMEAQGGGTNEVQRALASRSGTLIGFLRQAGVERLQTGAVAFTPQFDQPVRGQASRIVGYTGRMTVEFRTDPTKLGEVLGGALSNGANAIDGATLHPRQEEMDAAHARLAAAATRSALAEAKEVAEAAGVRAGPVRSLVVDDAPLPPPRTFALARAAAPAGPPPTFTTEAGETEVAAHVTAVVTLVGP